MTPRDYLRSYHNIELVDERLGVREIVDVRKYHSGYDDGRRAEFFALSTKLLPLVGDLKILPAAFTIGRDGRIDGDEQFHAQSVIRTYAGKGSPNEIWDTLRLAWLCGRIGPGAYTVKDYVSKFIGTDCNGFVGNFLGMSPEVKPRIWVQGAPTFSPDIVSQGAISPVATVATLNRLNGHLTARRTPDEIRTGDILVTVVNNKPVFAHEHIALVEEYANGVLSLAEWGQEGDYSAHAKDHTNPAFVERSPMSKAWSYYGLAWKSGEKYRHFFAPPAVPDTWRPGAWGRCGIDDA